MTTHDPALCLKTACDLCDVYAEGYSRGKDAAYSEIQARLCSGHHGDDCGCRPCLIVRRIQHVLRVVYPDDPDPT